MKKYLLSIAFALVAVLTSMAQVTVTGTVFEPGEEPAIGATVSEKGKPANATATDIDGQFTLKVASDKATLVVSYIGMDTQEVPLNGQTNVTINLKANAVALDEVVVVGYGTQKKINATGAVRTIDDKVLESRPVGNAVEGLQGAVAGLNITNDAGGAPGTAMNINIRGVGSIGEGSTSSPLILIDGMEGDLNSLNPNDIESVSVLKDAAAASIYGSRAPFGVILVTTKGGEKGVRVNYSGNVRFQHPNKVPDEVDSYTYCLMINDACVNAGGSPNYGAGFLQSVLDYQEGRSSVYMKPWGENASKWSDFDSYANTNWYKEHMKNIAVSQEHNFSLNGGSEKTLYYLSANYLDQGGIFRHADEKYQRLALTGKVNVKFNNYVSLNWTTRLNITNNRKPSALNSLFYHNIGRRNVLQPAKLPDGQWHEESLIQSLEDGGNINSKTQQVYNQLNLLITPIKDWNIHAEINSRIENNPYTRQFNPISLTDPDGSTRYLSVFNGVSAHKNITSSGTFDVYPAAGETYYEKANTNINYFSTNFYTDYTLNIKDKHHFKFLVGVQTEYFKQEIIRVASSNILTAETPFLPSEVGGETTMNSESKGEWSSVGVFGRINYNFMDRYMLEFNLRADGASRFPKDKRWSTFPSVSLGWNVAQEEFWEDWSTVCNYLKLRGSYGKLGNQNTSSFYPYYQAMKTSGINVVLGGQQAVGLPVYAPFSTNLTWEKIENVGAGLDFAFLNNRLQGSFDWYQRTTKDMVGPAAALAAVFGAAAPKTNNAELRTRGWEFEVSWRDRIGKDFNYSISASISDYKTKVTKYDSPDGALAGWYQGKDYGEIWGFETLGIAPSDNAMREYLAQHSQSSIGNNWGGGDIMYKNQDSDPAINKGSQTLTDHGDLVKLGNTTPRYAYSFTLEASWKFIDLRAYFQGIGKRDYFVESATFFGFGGNRWQLSLFKDHLDYFRYAGSELGANLDPYFGRLRTDANNIQCSDRFIQNASYLRLKNLTIGFSLPRNTKIARYVQKARLYFSGENLFTWTKLKILDPEALNASDGIYGGGAGKTYPQYKTYSIGLELTF